jgi:hypothetical protein
MQGAEDPRYNTIEGILAQAVWSTNCRIVSVPFCG